MKNYIDNSKAAAYVKANESYCIIYFANGSHLVKCRPIKHYAASFEAQGWCRIHRSYMVNPIYINSISPDKEFIYLETGQKLPIARRKIKAVLKWRHKSI